MGVLRYLRYGLFDLVLCMAASSALAFTAGSAFFATQALQPYVWPFVAVCVVCVLAFYLCAYNMRCAVAGGAVCVVAFVVACAVCARVSPGTGVLDDVAGNNVILLAVCALASLLVFVPSRRTVPCVAMLVVGVVLCAAIEYLYWYGHVLAFCIFVISAAALCMYRRYQRSLRASDTEQLSFGAVTASALVLALVSVLAGAGVFAAVIAPLQPGNLVVKLITEHVRLDEVEVVGTGDETSVPNEQLFSNVTSAEQTDASRTMQGSNAATNMENAETSTQESPTSGSAVALTESGETDAGAPVGLDVPAWMWVLVPVLVVLLVLAVIFGRRYLRARRLRTILGRSPAEQVCALYPLFMKRLGKLGLGRTPSQTLAEYTAGSGDALAAFEQTRGQAAFVQMSDVYAGAVYGGCPVSTSASTTFVDYYRAFPQRVHKRVGSLRYVLWFFRV